MNISERIFNRCVVTDDGCWEWQGFVNNWGYGKISFNGNPEYVHRLMCPDLTPELIVDHLCRNTTCCNPEHLEPVTHAENIRRGYEAKNQTHCKRGHDLADAYVKKDGGRDCRACRRERHTEDRGWTIRYPS